MALSSSAHADFQAYRHTIAIEKDIRLARYRRTVLSQLQLPWLSPGASECCRAIGRAPIRIGTPIAGATSA